MRQMQYQTSYSLQNTYAVQIVVIPGVDELSATAGEADEDETDNRNRIQDNLNQSNYGDELGITEKIHDLRSGTIILVKTNEITSFGQRAGWERAEDTRAGEQEPEECCKT